MEEIYNTIVVGSGPAGLTAGIYASRAELKPLLLAGLAPGGQLMMTTEVENYPGFEEGILGPDLMQKMIKQAERFGTKIIYEEAQKIDVRERPFKITTEKGTYLAKTIILAMGAEANWLQLPNEQRLRGKGVSACATCDGFFFRGKEVVVVGGGDSAMEEADFLTKFASKVTVLHRSEEFKASKIMLARARNNPKVSFIHNVSVIDVLGQDKVEGVKLKNMKTGEISEYGTDGVFKTDGLFLAIGHTPTTKSLDGQIDLDHKGYILVKDNTRTNIEGVLSAGDINDPRYRQAVVAAGMGSMAALDVEKYLANLEAVEHAEQ